MAVEADALHGGTPYTMTDVHRYITRRRVCRSSTARVNVRVTARQTRERYPTKPDARVTEAGHAATLSIGSVTPFIHSP